MICERFDTIVVPFPFSDVPVLKRRPAVVLSNPRFNAENAATLVGMITTAKASIWPSDHPINDLVAAGLDQACIVRWRLATIPNSLIQRKLGRLAAIDRLSCERLLAEMVAA
ncbi:MAG: type II toxin-antitoxin system PemK/MazF family toxin [Tabrizicola sp.]|nr:type II toxin-antitoxin system PemK/MazF family toxin [Tabrizicola sp.]